MNFASSRDNRPIAQVDWQMTGHASLYVNADYYLTG
jgi:hypothetical protein